MAQNNTNPNEEPTMNIFVVEDVSFKDLLELWSFVHPGEDILTIDKKRPNIVTTKATLALDYINEKVTISVHPSQ